MTTEGNPQTGARQPGSTELSRSRFPVRPRCRVVRVLGVVWALAAALWGWTGGGDSAVADLLYQTDFEEFTAGPDQWAGFHGWTGDNIGFGAHGIDQDAIPGSGLGKTAFIGLNQPQSTLVSVAKPFNYDPGPEDLPIVEVDTLIGIKDSLLKPNRDSFLVSILNSDGEFLAGIQFANQPASYGVWRDDGVDAFDTGVLFFRSELHPLYLRIDPQANRWSAELDGIPLFTSVPFTSTTYPVNFGKLAYEWMLTGSSPASHGDNWMIVVDTIVRTVADEAESVGFASFDYSPTGATMSWQGLSGYDYKIDYGSDMVTWFNDLPGSSFTGIVTSGELSFTDSAPGSGPRYYRLLRTHSP